MHEAGTAGVLCAGHSSRSIAARILVSASARRSLVMADLVMVGFIRGGGVDVLQR